MYWQDRLGKSQQELTKKGVAKTEKQLIKYYTQSMETVVKEFENTYLKLLETMVDGKQPTPADLYNLGKYWELQGQLKLELEKLGDKQAALFSKRFTQQYLDVYNSFALKDVDGYFHTVDRATAQQMINNIWCADGKSWSSRIWTNTDKLQQTLNDNLIDCVVTGKKSTELKNILQEEFEVSYRRADSIVRTEMAHIQTQAAQQRYKDSGITEVEVWADLDERRCDICGELHETRHNINGAMPVPAHPNCRCVVIPVVEENNQLMVI